MADLEIDLAYIAEAKRIVEACDLSEPGAVRSSREWLTRIEAQLVVYGLAEKDGIKIPKTAAPIVFLKAAMLYMRHADLESYPTNHPLWNGITASVMQGGLIADPFPSEEQEA
ncbi:MAG: hypothetical protein N2C14_06825 [Planctomycetales bacterium]